MTFDLSNLPHSLRVRIEEMYKLDFDLKRAKAIQEEKRMAKFWHDNRPRSADGIGEQVMCVHPFVDNVWRAARGPDVWADKDFKKWFLAHSPETRVSATGTKTMVGYGGPGSTVRSSEVRGQRSEVSRDPRPRTLVKKYA